ncbi:MAG: peptidoglycan editing factor PgeF [Thermomicrobiales bacterium]|nr:peptidoglycan editing factor PgeF [Thermomicrobiales bacterium]
MSQPATAGHVAYRFSSLSDAPLIHGMSGRVPSAGHQGDVGHGRDTDSEIIERNRNAFLADVGIDPGVLTLGRQTHGNSVEVVTARDRGRGRFPKFDGFPTTDALVTDDPTIALGVIVADCVPLLLFDPVHHAVGVVHAGWRGTVSGIATSAVETMQAAFGTQPTDLQIGIGPSIGPCCYEVGSEVIDAWRARCIDRTEAAVANGGRHLDLWTANLLNLQAADVHPSQVEISGVCVRCRIDRFFSYRAARQGAAHAGRMLLVAQLAERTGE